MISSIRIPDEIIKKGKELVEKYPDKYKDFSHVVRCSIIRLYNKEIIRGGINAD